MKTMEINPEIERFVVFSGGGGLVTREASMALEGGLNQITVREVPASFDPETFVLELTPEAARLTEFVIKKPNRQYVDDNLRREGACAQRLINDSVELGERRPEILEICEAVKRRTYLDEEVHLVIWVEVDEARDATLKLSYFIDDARFKWKPTILVELDENWEEAHVKGFIAIENESAKRFDNVEVSFADFAKEMSGDATNEALAPKKLKRAMKGKRMMMQQIF